MKYAIFRKRIDRRRGITGVLVLAMLPVLMGLAALTIDTGRLYNTRIELQDAADAAALAAAQKLGGLDPVVSIQEATATASEFIALNPVWDNQPITDYDVIFGQSRLKINGTGIDFTPDVVPANSVQVTVRYNMHYTFASVLGITSSNVYATAIAGIGARDFMIAIDASGSMTKQSVEVDVCADLDTWGIPHPPYDPNNPPQPGKGDCVKIAKDLTYDGVIGGSEFWTVFNVGDAFMPPDMRILPSKSAKDAAVYGVDIVKNAGYDDQIGTASFEVGAPWAQEMTTDYDLVRSKIRGLNKYGGSDIAVGILASRTELTSIRAREGADKVMVVFADGNSDVDPALVAAQLAADDGITIYTIGLGTNVDAALLQGIADIGGGIFFLVPNNVDEAIYGPQLKQAFQTIASSEVKYGLIQ